MRALRHPGVPQPGGLRRRARPQDRGNHRREAFAQEALAASVRQEAQRRAEGARQPHLRRLRVRLHAAHALRRAGPRVRVPAVQRAFARFAKYDVETGKAIGGSKAPLVTSVATVIGLAGIGYFLTQLL